MLRHVIIWKLKDGLADLASVKAGIKEGLEGLVGQVPGLLRVKVYVEGADPSMVMLDSYLASAEALKGYATHPAHVAVANAKVRPYTQARHCLDFEGDSEFSELVWERRSFRKFKADLPAKELVDEVVRAGLLAPTGRNKQSSVVLRIDDPELREEIRAKNAEIMGAPPPGRPGGGAPMISAFFARISSRSSGSSMRRTTELCLLRPVGARSPARTTSSTSSFAGRSALNLRKLRRSQTSSENSESPSKSRQWRACV